MPVYVDDSQINFGRMVMCHMLADTRAELDAMADKIGLDRRHIQRPGSIHEHYDVCRAYRKRAVAAGAVEINWRDVYTILRARKAALFDRPETTARP